MDENEISAELIDASAELLGCVEDIAEEHDELNDQFIRNTLELSYTCVVAEQISKIDKENHVSCVENVLEHLRVVIHHHLEMTDIK